MCRVIVNHPPDRHHQRQRIHLLSRTGAIPPPAATTASASQQQWWRLQLHQGCQGSKGCLIDWSSWVFVAFLKILKKHDRIRGPTYDGNPPVSGLASAPEESGSGNNRSRRLGMAWSSRGLWCPRHDKSKGLQRKPCQGHRLVCQSAHQPGLQS